MGKETADDEEAAESFETPSTYDTTNRGVANNTASKASGKPDGTSDEQDDVIVARSLRVVGSVHGSGHAAVTIRSLHSWNKKRSEIPFAVSGSVHEVGTADTTVHETARIPDGIVPPSSDGPTSGFVDAMESDLRWKASVMDIDTVIIIEDDTPERLKALGDKYGTVYDEVNLKGSVHETGSIDVTIDDCYVVD